MKPVIITYPLLNNYTAHIQDTEHWPSAQYNIVFAIHVIGTAVEFTVYDKMLSCVNQLRPIWIQNTDSLSPITV